MSPKSRDRLSTETPLPTADRNIPTRLANTIAVHRQGDLKAAAQAYHAILDDQPGCFDALHLLGHIAKTQGDFSRAIDLYRRAITLRPSEAEFHYSLGVVRQEVDQLEEAATSYRRALELNPGHVQAQENLAVVLAAQAKHGEAAALLEQVAASQPHNPQPLINLAEVLRQMGDTARAIEVGRRAVAVDPHHLTAHSNLAVILGKAGDVQGALVHLHRVRELDPTNRKAHSALLQLLHYLPSVSPQELYDEHRRWNAQHSAPTLPDAFASYRNAAHKLRVGYVSPDFRSHVVAQFLEPLLKHHDRSQIELYAYANVAKPDAVTERLKTLFDAWRDIHRRPPEQVAAQIRQDNVHILVDLAGHTSGNRLDVFVLRPAPVQVSYLGYPNTTGLDAIDYRITDTRADPPGHCDKLASEILVRLDPTFLCFSAPSPAPPVGPIPAIKNGYITFGSLNNILKITEPLLQEWAALLRVVPQSRLTIKRNRNTAEDVVRRLLNVLADQGIERERLMIHGFVPDGTAFLELYNDIDIALDTFPYHGTTTTCDALWMGTPVVTLAGDTHVSRVGVSLLSAVGLQELVAKSPQDYRRIAVALAGDLSRLQNLRGSLRDRVAGSPLANAPEYTRRFEDALKYMWHKWCIGSNPSGPSTPVTHKVRNMSSASDITRPIVCTALPDGVEVCVPDSLEDFTHYVLREQGDWFEPDVRFMRTFLQPGMAVADWGAGYGIYALTAARSVGNKGLVLAWEDEGPRAQCLDKAVRLNAFGNLRRLPIATPNIAAIQPEVAAALPARIDFMRIDAQIDALACLASNEQLLRTQSPLLMVFIGEETAMAPEVTNYLSALSYAPYALVPGLNQLVPYEANLADTYRLNLYFCKNDRAAQLLQRGLLGRWLDGHTESLPSWRKGQGLERISNEAYAAGFANLWSKLPVNALQEPGLISHFDALDLHAAAHAEETRNDLRFALLTAALSKVSEAVHSNATPARLQTLARICSELGLRQHAVEALDALVQHFLADIQVQLDEPFLAVSAAAAATDSHTSPGQWCLMTVLEARETLRHFSSFFYSPEEIAFLDEIERAGLSTPPLAKRRTLLQRRAPLTRAPAPAPLSALR